MVVAMASRPLQEPAFLVLSALAAGPLHGYGIAQDVESSSDGRVTLRAGTLYGAIDRLVAAGLVEVDREAGERKSSGGILIPATAQMSKRLAWAEVVAVGPNVRAMQVGDRVLFNPEDRYEVEVRGEDYIILRERDVHAVAASRLGEASTGLYL